jgi:hypothetical protein
MTSVHEREYCYDWLMQRSTKAQTTRATYTAQRRGCGSIARSARIKRRSRAPCRHPVGRRHIKRQATQCARYTASGHEGATIQHPGWGGADIGFLPLPLQAGK